jgi:hypothetical protein
MAIDIRATVTCSLGTLISASVSDDYIQGNGLVKTKGNCEISGLITPAIGTAVTFSYTKDGITYDVPRTLRVLSSFADPFRRTTKVELGCKLTYLQDLQEPLKWDYTDDPDNSGVDPADSAIITIPIAAASIAGQCLTKLGIAGTAPLSNKFSIAQFDFGAGYVSILSDLLVSECLCGYLDDTETLQLINLSAAGGTGPVFTSANVIDIAQIGVGQLPGDAVTVSYSSLKLNAPEPVDPDEPEEQKAEKNWEREETIGAPSTVLVSNPFYDSNPFPVAVPEQWEYTYTPRTVTVTAYDTLDRVTTRTTTQYTILAELAPAYLQHKSGQYQEWAEYGPPDGSNEYTIVTTETYTYNVAAPAETPKADPPDGYQEVERQVQEVSEPCIKMWASTQIYDMAGQPGGTVFQYRRLNTDRFTASRTITVPNAGTTQAGTPCTKSTTETLRANGYTQKGQQALASALTRNQGNADFYTTLAPAFLSAALVLQSEGTETRISTGRDIGLEQRASAADRINKESAKGEGEAKPDPNNGWRTASESEIELALGSPLATRRITLSMPYAPDDIFTKSGSPPSVTYSASPSDAPTKSRAYGRAQNMLLMGNRYGINVQMAPEMMPAAPFSPFVLQANGLSALYRTNGTSWTMSADGILASTDALFWGAVGGTGTFWFPVAPGITTLPTTPAVVDGEMTVTTPVPVWNETVPVEASTVLGLTVQSLPYALDLLTEVGAISTVLGVGAKYVTAIDVPASGITLEALAPTCFTGAILYIPSTNITYSALAPLRAGPSDPDAADYIARVEAADGSELEFAVRDAFNDFVLGCKADGIWTAIKASCILAGARTLNGALVPLMGTAPTNVNFVSADYDRKTGLVGDGSSKYLNSNRANNADPQNSNHNAVYVSTAEVSGTFGIYLGAGDIANGSNNLGRASSPSTDMLFRSRVTGTAPSLVSSAGGATGFVGMSRASSSSFTGRVNGANQAFTNASSTPVSNNVLVFKRESAGTTTARLAFYSIGESLDLALLDTRVTTLMTAFNAAIP